MLEARRDDEVLQVMHVHQSSHHISNLSANKSFPTNSHTASFTAAQFTYSDINHREHGIFRNSHFVDTEFEHDITNGKYHNQNPNENLAEIKYLNGSLVSWCQIIIQRCYLHIYVELLSNILMDNINSQNYNTNTIDSLLVSIDFIDSSNKDDLFNQTPQ